MSSISYCYLMLTVLVLLPTMAMAQQVTPASTFPEVSRYVDAAYFGGYETGFTTIGTMTGTPFYMCLLSAETHGSAVWDLGDTPANVGNDVSPCRNTSDVAAAINGLLLFHEASGGCSGLIMGNACATQIARARPVEADFNRTVFSDDNVPISMPFFAGSNISIGTVPAEMGIPRHRARSNAGDTGTTASGWEAHNNYGT